MIIINDIEFNAIRFESEREPYFSFTEEECRECLATDPRFVDYTDVIDDWSMSQARAYIYVDGESVEVPDGWWIIYNDKCKFMVDPATYNTISSNFKQEDNES